MSDKRKSRGGISAFQKAAANVESSRGIAFSNNGDVFDGIPDETSNPNAIMNNIYGQPGVSASELEAEIERLQQQKLIHQQDGYTVLGKFAVSPIGLQVSDDITFEEWFAFSGFLRSSKTAWKWIFADYINISDIKKFMTYQEISDQLFPEFQPDSIKQYAHVSRNIDALIRINGQDFAFAQLVASKNISMEEKAFWLNKAYSQKFSVTKLAVEMNGYLPPSKIPAWEKKLNLMEKTITKKTWSRMSEDSRRRMYDRLTSLIENMEKWGLE